MGMITEMQTEAWQKKAGLSVPSPGTRELWHKLQDAAFEAIKVAELEKSGIRDGDGSWHGGDVLGGLWSDLKRAVASLEAAYGAAHENLEQW